MIVVADTSPITYLAQLELTHLLPALYGDLVLPEAVQAELLAIGAPKQVRRWAADPPAWVRILSPTRTDPGLEALDAGERAAVLLSLELSADVLLVDERKARRIARERFGLHVSGTLGVLRDAHGSDLIDGVLTLQRLTAETSFRYTPRLVRDFLAALTQRQ